MTFRTLHEPTRAPMPARPNGAAASPPARPPGAGSPGDERKGAAVAGHAATAQLITMSELEPGPRRHAAGEGAGPAAPALADALADPHHPLRRVKAKLAVCVGAVEVSIGDLMAAREHQVLCLDRTVDQPVEVMLEGQVVARGTLVAVDDHFAVRITELPVVLQAPGSGPA